MFTTRPATKQEIIARYREGFRVSFEAYVREVYDPRAENGVRHIKKGSSKIRHINGCPMVVRHGELYELHATVIVLDSGVEVVSLPTIR